MLALVKQTPVAGGRHVVFRIGGKPRKPDLVVIVIHVSHVFLRCSACPKSLTQRRAGDSFRRFSAGRACGVRDVMFTTLRTRTPDNKKAPDDQTLH